MKTNRTITLVLCILVGIFLGSILQVALASSDKPLDYTTEELAAPAYGRPAPYGQWIVTHNAVSSITTTLNYGTVARTNGYDQLKTLICDNSGSYTMTVNLYGRTTSTGSLYDLRVPFTTINPGASAWISFTETGPWMSVGITSTDGTTGTTATCGIYVQTP